MRAGRPTAARVATFAVTGVAGLAAIAATAAVGPSGAAAATKAPPCTQAALQAGLTRGADPVRNAHVTKPFGCSGKWAYAAVDTKRFTLTSLFEVGDGRWSTADRAKACQNGAVPRAIRKPACESN
jgi:hypothetical protein